MQSSEFRYHTTTGEWVLINSKRDKRPNELKKKKVFKRKPSPINSCPFENPQKNGNRSPYFWFPEKLPLKNWQLQIVENKFPAVYDDPKSSVKIEKKGIYETIPGFGYHDLLITRDHFKSFPDLSNQQGLDVLLAFQKRYRQLALDKRVKYISLFNNWGAQAGASIFHPHYQILALPVVSHTIRRSLDSSFEHNKKHHRCIHCEIIKREASDKKRIVFQNKKVIAFTPFASKEPFQINIFLKKHSAYFEDESLVNLSWMSKTLKQVLGFLKKKINDPDYNFFIHTAPVFQKNKHFHYHWHIEVVPKSNISAGFELGTGVEINSVFPEEAARILRKSI
jgi:UDPglucose--hexose-1-phosphate uridylyltransferase